MILRSLFASAHRALTRGWSDAATRQFESARKESRMLHKRTPYLIAAAALVAGAGAGAGSDAAFGTDGANTTTVVQQSVAAGSPAPSTKTKSVNAVDRTRRDGVVEIRGQAS